MNRTEIIIADNPDKIGQSSKILSIGSGFSNLFMDQLAKNHFSVNSNPFGDIYNPTSIFDAIEIIAKNKEIASEGYTEIAGSYRHFNFHSSVSASSKDDLMIQLDDLVDQTHAYFKQTDFLFITLGTAYEFRLNKSHKTVANCHQRAQADFEKVLLSPEQIVAGFRKVYKLLNHVKNIILVVSPIMHTGDSITLNAVSKSALRLACHQIMSEFPYVKYFPAYEFLLSDLRDYSNYEKDMILPNEEAMEYIFKKFSGAYL